MVSDSENVSLGWICSGCAKHVTSGNKPYGPCADCGGRFRQATVVDLECDRCGNPNAQRLADRTEYERLCRSCINVVLTDE